MMIKKEEKVETKRINPVYEYLKALRGQVFVNDPLLLV